MGLIRVLFVSDTHLGFDMPARPRVARRRRGPDFFANFERALAPALAGEVDLVVHGGDILYRSRVPARLVDQAFAPLRRVADAGVPVFVVPGNHERSRIPHPLLAVHPGVHIFHAARTFAIDAAGVRVAVGGFPYARNVRPQFRDLVARTGLTETAADVRLLCVHHCVEGARVGPSDFTFRDAADVIRGADLPRDVAAVLSGHIHRHQVLTSDLRRRALPAPVVYPGSVERTSFAERDETKGYVVAEVEPGPGGGRLAGYEFRPLPARPMVCQDLRVGIGRARLEHLLGAALDRMPDDAVVSLRLRGRLAADEAPVLSAAALRARKPHMNVSVSFRP